MHNAWKHRQEGGMGEFVESFKRKVRFFEQNECVSAAAGVRVRRSGKKADARAAFAQDSLDAERHSGEQARQRLTQRLEESEQERLVLAEKLEKVSSLVEASKSGQDQVTAALEQATRLAEQRLEEARLELADVKAKWCQQVTALETQVARLSVQAGEEGVERRAAEERLRLAEQSLATLAAQLEQKVSLDDEDDEDEILFDHA